MALNAEILKDLIVANVAAVTGNAVRPEAEVVWGAIAAAIVAHITTSGVIVINAISLAPASLTGTTIPGGAPISGPGGGIIL